MDGDYQKEGAATSPQSLVTEDYVKKVLLADKGKEARLLSWKVIDFTEKGDNYSCTVSSVVVKYFLNEDPMTSTYIVKLNPNRGVNDFEAIVRNFFQKEATFYAELVPELNSVLEDHSLELLNFAPCFHYSLESGKEQLYLEDMRPKGFRMYDKKKGMDLAHASLVMKVLGRLHATSLLLEEKTHEPIESKHSYLNKDFINMGEERSMLPLLERSIDSGVMMLQKASGYERAIAWCDSLRPKLEYLLTTFMKSDGFNVVNHGDCWTNNMLFRYSDSGDPVEVMLIDLQICRKASLAIDLNYFFYTSMTGDDRKSHLKQLLGIYYTSFKTIMDAGGLSMLFTEEELFQEFRAKNTIGAYFAMMVLPIILLESDDVPDLTTKTNEDGIRIMEEFKEKAIAMVGKNPIMKLRFLSAFDEFMETGLIP